MSKKENTEKLDKLPAKEVPYIPLRVLILKNQVIGVSMPGKNSAVVNRIFTAKQVITDQSDIQLLINNNAEFEDISPR